MNCELCGEEIVEINGLWLHKTGDPRHMAKPKLTTTKAEELLTSAVRQYRHNVGEQFVFAYDREETLKVVNNLLNDNR